MTISTMAIWDLKYRPNYLGNPPYWLIEDAFCSSSIKCCTFMLRNSGTMWLEPLSY